MEEYYKAVILNLMERMTELFNRVENLERKIQSLEWSIGEVQYGE